MTSVYLVRDLTGRLISCKAQGHSGYERKGKDIVCAAISILLRTAMQTLSDTDGLEVVTNVALHGEISFFVKQLEFSEKITAKLEYSGDFLEKGFESLTKEFPENVKLYKQTEA